MRSDLAWSLFSCLYLNVLVVNEIHTLLELAVAQSTAPSKFLSVL